MTPQAALRLFIASCALAVCVAIFALTKHGSLPHG